MTFKHFTTPLLAAFIALGAGGCAANRTAPRLAEPLTVPAAAEVVVANTHFRKEYVLVPEDTLDIVVLRYPEVSQSCVVRPDGNISLPIVDEMHVAGLSPSELDDRLTERLASRLVNPEVTVVVTKFRAPAVYVMGEVVRPAAVPLRDASTVLQAIARCGDFATGAATDSVVLVRLTAENELVAQRINVDAAGRGKVYLALANLPLQADDIIFVPKTRIARLSTFLNQNISPILNTLNSGVATVTNVKFIKLIDRQVEWLEKETDAPDGTAYPPINPTPQ